MTVLPSPTMVAYEASDNPFAVVVMTHLKAQETKQDKQSRKEWKLTLIRRLYEKGYNRKATVNLFAKMLTI